MDVMVQIPDELARRLGVTGSELSRRALEALALEEYRLGHIRLGEFRRALGFATRGALDGFMKSRGVSIEYSLEDLERDRDDLARLGF